MRYEEIGETAMFTGHRHIPTTECLRLEAALDDVIRSLYDKGIRNFISGAALGFDTLAAKAVCRAREHGLPVSLTLAIPCMHQELRWPKVAQATYAELLRTADRVVYTSYTPYYNGCMQVRNRYMIDHASVCVAYFNGGNGGTAATWRMAKQFGRMVINLCETPPNEKQMMLTDLGDPI